MSLDRAGIRAAARETLGVARLLPGQAAAVSAITSGRDTLALLPTGGGKSAIYQLAGVEIDGPTVVVSPLIALQQDQLASLAALDLPGAALNSTVPAATAGRPSTRSPTARSSSSSWRRSSSRRPTCSTGSGPGARRSSSWTRPTASPRGGTTSGPSTAVSARWPTRSDGRRSSR